MLNKINKILKNFSTNSPKTEIDLKQFTKPKHNKKKMESNIQQQKPTIKNNNTLEFWRPNQDNGIFSNFYAATVEIKGKSWPTNEHYF